MEKYSQFRDPLTGIHPFTTPKKRILRPRNLLIFLTRLFILPFFLIFPNCLFKYFIEIKTNKKHLPNGTYAVNYGSIFDIYILRYLYGKCNIYYLTNTNFLIKEGSKKKNVSVLQNGKLNFVFVEECESNNSCIMKFVRNIDVSGVVGLKYTGSCVYMYGSKFRFLLRFLASVNECNVNAKIGGVCDDLMEVTGFVKVDRGKDDYQRFYEMLDKNK